MGKFSNYTLNLLIIVSMSLVARLKGVRYYGIPKITEIPLFCKFLLHKKLVIHVLSPIMRFSAILRYAIVRFYCISMVKHIKKVKFLHCVCEIQGKGISIFLKKSLI